MVKLTIFRATGAWLVVIDNSKLMRPAVCSEEERGLISQTAAGNWAYSDIRLTETPYWWRNATQIRLVRKDGKFAWTSQMHYLDLGTDALSAVFPSTSFRREASGGVTKCQLFSQSRISVSTMLEIKGRTGKTQTKSWHHCIFPSFWLSQYISCSPVWQFCTTWTASCKQPVYGTSFS